MGRVIGPVAVGGRVPKTAPSTTTAEPEPKLDSTRTTALSRSVTSIPSSKVTAMEVYCPVHVGLADLHAPAVRVRGGARRPDSARSATVAPRSSS